MPNVADETRQNLKTMIDTAKNEKKVMTLVVDESTDGKERSILNIILRFQETSFLLDILFLDEPVNFNSFSQWVNNVMVKFDLLISVFFL